MARFNLLDQLPSAQAPAMTVNGSDSEETHHGRFDLSGASRVSSTSNRAGKKGGSSARGPTQTSGKRKTKTQPRIQGGRPSAKRNPKKQRLIKPQFKKHQPLGSKGTKQTQLREQQGEYIDAPSESFRKAFEWNALYTSRLNSLMESHHPTGTPPPPVLSGHFEFAGGGGAEVACLALSALGTGVKIDVKAQSDWSDLKRKALELQDPEGKVCRFGDIMNLVDPEARQQLFAVREVVELSQYELHGMLGIERCRVVDGDEAPEPQADKAPHRSSSSSASSSPSESSSDSSSTSFETEDMSMNTDESEVLRVNDVRLLSNEDISQKIHNLFDKKGKLKLWRTGARIISAVDGKQMSHDNHEGIVAVLVELAGADHNDSRELTIERRQGQTQ